MNKRFVCIIAIVGCSLAIGSLLAGFTPPPQQKQLWQDKVSLTPSYSYSSVSLSDSEVNTWQTSHDHSSSQQVTKDNRLPEGRHFNQAMLTFENDGVSLLTHMGPRQLPGFDETPVLIALTDPHFPPTNTDIHQPIREITPLISNAQHEQALPLSDPKDNVISGFVCLNLPSLRPNALPTQMPSFSRRVANYKPTVQAYAQKYGLDISLVMAIIQIESGFNPTAVSSRGAHGLMQVVPQTAGGEVHRWLGKHGLPTPSELLDPEFNIRYGIAYLHLLRTQHFAGITDPQSMEYCMIAAYNGGSGAVLRLFAHDRNEAVQHINSLTSDQVLATLTKNFPARETRDFVRNVLNSRYKFLFLAQAG